MFAHRLARGDADVGAGILETAAAWEQDGIAHGEMRPIIGAVDETFLEHMMLVFMDLASGVSVAGRGGGRIAPMPPGTPWWTQRLKTLGAGVLYLVSDRAKALIKLADTGLECLSMPDLFHLVP